MTSIFLKSCPECAEHIAVRASACSCGYEFESNEAGEFLTIQARVRDERLYEEYLRARAQQAQAGARLAAELAGRYPHDLEKAAIAARERLAAEQAEAELAAQAARVAAMKTDAAEEVARTVYAAA